MAGTTIELLKDYLPKYGWPAFQVIEDTLAEGKILTGWHSEFVDETRVMFVALDHQKNTMLVAVPAVVSAPQQEMPIGQLADVLMALGFANFALPMGGFAYDPRDGEIRFECGVPIDGATLTFEQFAHILNTSVTAVSYWAPRLNAVAGGVRTSTNVVESFLGHVADFAGTGELAGTTS